MTEKGIRTLYGLQTNFLPEDSYYAGHSASRSGLPNFRPTQMIYRGIPSTQKLVNTHLHTLSGGTDTYGKMFNNASVIPRPARSTGVRPILGLMVEPVNGPTGDSYKAFLSELGCWFGGKRNVPRTWVLPRDRGWLRWRGRY